MEQVAEELKEFKLEKIDMPKDETELSLFKDERESLKVKADTLIAFLSPTRAVMSQKSPAPLTRRDLRLREKILQLYNRDRPTPFPWSWSVETKFEVEK
ncbi:hypothetical protein KEJ47_09505 [Candidatus Bathyarchaeota archaeon]|nr:hypothetical protein [Candidatus Bathyarchaeota archaeon]